jgi:hypothetical protein
VNELGTYIDIRDDGVISPFIWAFSLARMNCLCHTNMFTWCIPSETDESVDEAGT